MALNILVVDDDFDEIEDLFDSLRKVNYVIDGRKTLYEAYRRIIKSKDYRLIICDLIMPGLLPTQRVPAEFAKYINTDCPGLGFVHWLIDKGEIPCPILILSIVEESIILADKKIANRNIQVVSKNNLRGSELRRVVMSII